MSASDLEIAAVIGFKGSVNGALLLHPDQEHLVYPLGSTVVVRNILAKTQTFLQGHDDTISTLTLSPTGRFIASGQKTHMGFPADIIVWDFQTGEAVHRLRLHKVCVGGLSFSYNEKYLASLGGQDDNSVVVWDLETGKAICGSPAANDTAFTIKWFNQSDSKLVTAGNFNMRVWTLDVKSKKIRPQECNLGNLKRQITNLQISADDQLAYCGTRTGDLLEVRLERALFSRCGPAKKYFSLGITATALLPDGDVLVGTGEGIIARVNGQTFRIKSQCQLMGAVTTMSLTADAHAMFVGTAQSNVYWVDIDTLTPELRNTCHYDRINDVAFPHGYSDVFATCSVNDIRVWNAKNKTELLRIQVPNLECHCLVFMRDGKSIVSGWSDGKIRAFLPQSGRLLYVINDAHVGGVSALAATNDSQRIVSGGVEGELRVWRIGRQTQTMEASLKEHRGRIYDIKVRGNDFETVSGAADGSCIVWDLRSYTRSICLFQSTVFHQVVYHPDESQLLTTGSDRKITYWDTFDGQAIRILDGSEDAEVVALDITKEGEHFVSGGGDKVVKLWGYDEGVVRNLGIGHSGTISRLRISPDQRTIVSVGSEGAIFIWKVPEDVQNARAQR